jgi:hypothetical protein
MPGRYHAFEVRVTGASAESEFAKRLWQDLLAPSLSWECDLNRNETHGGWQITRGWMERPTLVGDSAAPSSPRCLFTWEPTGIRRDVSRHRTFHAGHADQPRPSAQRCERGAHKYPLPRLSDGRTRRAWTTRIQVSNRDPLHPSGRRKFASNGASEGGILVAARDLDGIGNAPDLVVKTANSLTPVGIWVNSYHGGFFKAQDGIYSPSIWSQIPIWAAVRSSDGAFRGAMLMSNPSRARLVTQTHPGQRRANYDHRKKVAIRMPLRLTAEPLRPRGPPSFVPALS